MRDMRLIGVRLLLRTGRIPMTGAALLALHAILMPVWAMAHHGGVSLAHGPGSPIDTASPLTLPRHGLVLSVRSEYVDYKKFSFADPANKDAFIFNSVGASYGISNWLTGSVFVPYTIKRQDTLGTNYGIGDLTVAFQLGFNHSPGKGFNLSKADDTAVVTSEVNKSYFALCGGFTLPTGPYRKALGGEVDPGMQSGFGSPSYMVGFAAGKPITGRLSLVADTSFQSFMERDNFRFGNEWRVNVASVRELYGKAGGFLARIDGVLEFNLLSITRDTEGGEGLSTTGGHILYVSPGLRLGFPKIKNANLGILFKVPAWKSLNEESEQQGSEGRENYRVVATLSFYF